MTFDSKLYHCMTDLTLYSLFHSLLIPAVVPSSTPAGCHRDRPPAYNDNPIYNVLVVVLRPTVDTVPAFQSQL